jgi:hypothetical protein
MQQQALRGRESGCLRCSCRTGGGACGRSAGGKRPSRLRPVLILIGFQGHQDLLTSGTSPPAVFTSGARSVGPSSRLRPLHVLGSGHTPAPAVPYSWARRSGLAPRVDQPLHRRSLVLPAASLPPLGQPVASLPPPSLEAVYLPAPGLEAASLRRLSPLPGRARWRVSGGGGGRRGRRWPPAP